MSDAAERPREAPLQERLRRRFLVFDGRIGRLEYLVAVILVPMVVWVAAVIAGLVLGLVLGWIAGATIATVFVWLIYPASIALTIWIGLAAYVRRSHDLGFTGWLVLLWLVLGIFGTIFLLVWPGEAGENKYGPQP